MHFSGEARCQKAIDDIYLKKKEVKSWDCNIEFGHFKSRFESCIFERISWLHGSFLRGDYQGFMKEGVKTHLMAQMPFSVFTSIVYGYTTHLLTPFVASSLYIFTPFLARLECSPIQIRSSTLWNFDTCQLYRRDKCRQGDIFNEISRFLVRVLLFSSAQCDAAFVWIFDVFWYHRERLLIFVKILWRTR